jgi:hypothetical protein
MHTSVRSPVTQTVAMLAAAAVTTASGVAVRDNPDVVPLLHADVRLAAAAGPPLGALIEQFLGNQAQNCSLICPFIVDGVVRVPVAFAVIPFTFARQLRDGEPLLRAIALTDATVSQAAEDAVNGIIDTDLLLVLPRAQNALEVAVVGLFEVGRTALTRPGRVVDAILTARSDIFDALGSPPGTMPPPPVHHRIEALAVRAIEIGSALTFQAPERALQGVAQAANAFFTTLGATGEVRPALRAVGVSVRHTIQDSAAFISSALSRPIPVSPPSTIQQAGATVPAARPHPTTVDHRQRVEVTGADDAAAGRPGRHSTMRDRRSATSSPTERAEHRRVDTREGRDLQNTRRWSTR